MARRLPVGYTELEYIESAGTQYINTGILAKDVDEVEMVLARTSDGASQYYLGTRNSSSTAIGYSLFFTGHGGVYYYPLTWSGSGRSVAMNTKFTTKTEFKNGTDKFYFNGTLINTHSYAQTSYNTGNELYLGAIRESSGSADYMSYAKFYSVIMKKDGVEVANYVPCYRTSDTKPGMYDLVNRTFYTNSGTGNFIAGPVVITNRTRLYNDDDVQNIADSIRAKNGSEDTYKLSEMSAAIDALEVLDGETVNITPSTSAQTITPSSGHNGITQANVSAVTSAIDGNIQADNIKKNISILGVVGTLESGVEPQKYSGHYDADGLARLGWTASDVQYYQENAVVWNAENNYMYEVTDEEVSDAGGTTARFLPKSTTISSSQKLTDRYSVMAIPYIDTSSLTTLSKMFQNCYSLLTIPELNFNAVTNGDNAFDCCYSLVTVPDLYLPNATSLKYMFNGCHSLKSVGKISAKQGVTMDYMFQNCDKLETVDELDISNASSATNLFTGCSSLKQVNLKNNGTTAQTGQMFMNCYNLVDAPYIPSINMMTQMFVGCYALKNVPLYDTSSVKGFANAFQNCYSLVSIPQLNTSSGTSFGNMFLNCYSLRSVPELDMSSALTITTMFSGCTALTDFGGFKDLGKAFLTSRAAGYANYTVNFASSPNMTHDSLMNLINKVYDIASAGCKVQNIKLGATNLAKLSAAEIAIATAKGWNVIE